VVAEGVERVDIEAGAVRGGKAFAEFEVKDLIAKPLTSDQFVLGLGKGNAKKGSLGSKWVER
jgi:hypothetical protein